MNINKWIAKNSYSFWIFTGFFCLKLHSFSRFRGESELQIWESWKSLFLQHSRKTQQLSKRWNFENREEETNFFEASKFLVKMDEPRSGRDSQPVVCVPLAVNKNSRHGFTRIITLVLQCHLLCLSDVRWHANY